MASVALVDWGQDSLEANRTLQLLNQRLSVYTAITARTLPYAARWRHCTAMSLMDVSFSFAAQIIVNHPNM